MDSEQAKGGIKEKLISHIQKIEQSTIVRSVRSGLVNMIPVMIVGAFALILMTFPVDGYQEFIETFADGFLYSLFNLAYAATFGVAVYDPAVDGDVENVVHRADRLMYENKKKHKIVRGEPMDKGTK